MWTGNRRQWHELVDVQPPFQPDGKAMFSLPGKHRKAPPISRSQNLLADQETGDERQSEGCHAAVHSVGGGRPQPGDQAREPPVADRPPDAQHPDRPDRRGDGKAHE